MNSVRRNTAQYAADVEQLLNNPALRTSLSDMREALVARIESSQMDGAPETEAALLEICRQLQTLSTFEQRLSAVVQCQRAREHTDA